MDSGFTGFNPEEIDNLANAIKNYATQTKTAIINNLKNGVIVPISKTWFTPEGVEYWKAFAEDVKKTAEPITDAFNTFIDNIGKAEKNWAESVGAEITAVKGDLEELDMTLDVSDIKSSDGSKIGIIESEATSVADKLSAVETTINTELTQIAQKLEASSAFLGGDQASSIKSCFESVSKEVAKVFNFLTEGDNNVMSQIKAAVDKYGNIATTTSNAFTSSSAGN